MWPPDIFFNFPLGLVVLVLLDGVRGETCSALTRAKPGENLTALREKAIANFELACRVKDKPNESNENESCPFVTEPAGLSVTKSILRPLNVPFRLNFTVRTGSDAAVVLSETSVGSSVQILLGSEGNSQSSMRVCLSAGRCGPNPVSTHQEPGIVSATERRPFWVEYRGDSVLAVGKGGQQHAFMEDDIEYFALLSVSVLYVGIASWGDVQADWVFYQFCEQLGDPSSDGAGILPPTSKPLTFRAGF